MKPFITFFLLLASAVAKPRSSGPAPTTPWVIYSWNSQGRYVPANTVSNSFVFPQIGRNVAYPTFLTTTTQTQLLGNLTGRVIRTAFTITTTGNPQFVYGGQLSGWNHGSAPANCRFFISTHTEAYSNQGYTADPNGFWWSAVNSTLHGGVDAISEATFQPERWSNANGHLASESPYYTQAFQSVVANVRQIGLAYGGGSFFDVGVAILNGTGTALFHLDSFVAE